MKKWINYIVLFIFTVLILGTIAYIAYTGEDLIYAKYITGITALLSLWYSVIQNQKNEKEKEAKVIVELSHQYIIMSAPPHIGFTIRNNSNYSLTNISIKLSKKLYFDDDRLESAIKGRDIPANDKASWGLNSNNKVEANETVKYTLFFYDNSGKKNKIKGRVINRL